jgi:hypothetical protein
MERYCYILQADNIVCKPVIETNLRRLQTAPVLDMEAKLLRENIAV